MFSFLLRIWPHLTDFPFVPLHGLLNVHQKHLLGLFFAAYTHCPLHWTRLPPLILPLTLEVFKPLSLSASP